MNGSHSGRPGLLILAAVVAIATATRVVLAAGAPAVGEGAAIALQGNGRGAPGCTGCHGPQGQGNSAAGYPRLAGLSAAYLDEQLGAFASGVRKNEMMLPVATALSPTERASLGAYFSGLRPVAAPPASEPQVEGSAASVQAGRALGEHGRWSGGLPACEQCHGPRGVGVGTAFPPLAGQPSSYLVNQLEAWKQGARPPGPLGLMSAVAGKLSEADIGAVAAYYSNQPATPPAAKEGQR